MGKIDPTYSTSVSVTGGREGRAVSDDGVLDVQLRRPKTNGASDGTNPEQLFAAAWAGCFQGALLAEAREAGEDASQSTVTAEVALGKLEAGGFGLGATITVDLPGFERERAMQIVEAAHKRCPYSRATSGNIEVSLIVT